MKKINIKVGKSKLGNNIYVVSKNSSLYSFFICEYHKLSEDGLGNLIIPEGEMVYHPKTEKKKSHKDNSVLISRSSPLFDYFVSEYSHLDFNGSNIVIPGEEMPRKK